MAWADVSGSNNTLEYENAATAANTYADAPGVYSGGIRTFTTPGTGQVNEIYARTRKKGHINLITYSEQFDNAYWGKSRTTIIANDTTAPDGSTTADRVTQGVGSSGSVYLNTVGGVSAGLVTLSVHAKKYPGSNIDYMWLQDYTVTGGGIVNKSYFNFSTGAIGTTDADHTVNVSDEGDSWYRFSTTMTKAGSGNAQFAFYCSDADNGTSATVGNSYYLWGAQVNEGVLTSYIDTGANISSTVERGELSKDFYDATHVGF